MKHTIIILVVLLAGSVFSASAFTGDTVRVPVDTLYGNIFASVYPDSVTCIPFTLSPYWMRVGPNNWVEMGAECGWYVDTKRLNGTLHIQIKTTSNLYDGGGYSDSNQYVYFYFDTLGAASHLFTSALDVATSSLVHTFNFNFSFSSPLPTISFSEETPTYFNYKTTGTIIITFTPSPVSIQNRIAIPTPSKTRNYNYKCYDILGRNIKNNFKANLPYISKNQIFIKLK